MSRHGFALFPTALGRCGIAWGPAGVVSVQLPAAREAETRKRLAERAPDAREIAPPAAIQGAIEAIVAHLRGEKADLAGIPLDMARIPPFHQRVYEHARTIPSGTTISYGELAARAGSPGGSRAVGQALGRNPFPIVIPCHRVLASNGRLGGFTAYGGLATKERLLAAEQEPKGPLDLARAVEHLREADPVLARLIDDVGPCGLTAREPPSVFAALAQAIAYQQLTGKAAATIFGRVKDLFPDPANAPNAEHLLTLSDESLRGAGLSRSKLASLRDLAQKTIDGTIPTMAALRGMDNESVVQTLTAVRGIGRWTVEMLLMFELGRPDVFPVDDYGVRKGFAVAFKKRELPDAARMLARGERWRPYRSVATWYLWRAAERASKPKST